MMNSIGQTILYPRPQSPLAVEALHIPGNHPYIYNVKPSPTADVPLGPSGDTNAVDIWAMGQILRELLNDVLHQIRCCGKSLVITKEPALNLIHTMLQANPERRPTAADYLKYPWMNESPSRLVGQKRDRSPGSLPTGPSANAELPFP